MRFSTLARPTIRPDEAEHADTAICRIHGGQIKHYPTQNDTEGTVLYCPVGECFWRYTRELNDVNQLPGINYGWNP